MGKRKKGHKRQRLASVPRWLLDLSRRAELDPSVESYRREQFGANMPEEFFRVTNLLYTLVALYWELYGHFREELDAAAVAPKVPGLGRQTDLFLPGYMLSMIDEQFGKVVWNLSDLMVGLEMARETEHAGARGVRFRHVRRNYLGLSAELEALAPGSVASIRTDSALTHAVGGCPLGFSGVGQVEARPVPELHDQRPHHLN